MDLLPPKDRAGEAPVRMAAVSARGQDPPRRRATGRRGGPLRWMPLAAGLDTAATALRRYGLRWRTGRFLQALKAGTRTGDRRPAGADGLSKRLAFDAITAFRVRDLSLLARGRPDGPAERHVTREDVTALRLLAARHGFKAARGPPDMAVAGFVTLAGGLAGLHPSKRQPLHGRRKLREGVRFLSHAVIAMRAMQDWEGNRSKGEKDTDSSVLD